MNKLLKKFRLRKRTRHKDADMTQGVIWRQLLEFSLPMMLGMLFQQFYNTVDTIVVGQFVGKEALAAVGSTGSIINMLVGLANGLAMGATVTISQCYGAHDYKKLHDDFVLQIKQQGAPCGAPFALFIRSFPSRHTA